MDPELVAYYRARLARYERDPQYPHSRAAEQALYDAVSSARTQDEARERMNAGQLALRAAIARVRDVETMRAAHWDHLQEPVRAAPHHEALRALDATPPASAHDLAELVSTIHSRASARITADEELRTRFLGALDQLDELERLERAHVPASWHDERGRAHAQIIAGLKVGFDAATVECHKFVPDWRPDWDALLAPRHRRRIPLPDAVLTERLARYRHIVGGA